MAIKLSFKDCLKQRRAWYKTLNPREITILNEAVVFNSKGFYHLRYDGQGQARSVKEYHYKLWLLPLVLPVIEQSKNIYEYKPKEYSNRLGKYFEIWELREDVILKEITGNHTFNISVILRRIGTGNIQFYSIWKNGHS